MEGSVVSPIEGRFITFADGSFGKLDAWLHGDSVEFRVFHASLQASFAGKLQ